MPTTLRDFANSNVFPLTLISGGARQSSKEVVYFQNGFMSESEAVPRFLLASISKTRMLRASKVLILKLIGCRVEKPEPWEIDSWLRSDVSPVIRAHFNPDRFLQKNTVLGLLGGPPEM